MMTCQSPLLRVRDVSKSFPGVQALDGVRLEVAAGTVHALMGENGAGKSTLMKILAGLEKPDSGEITFKGRAVKLRQAHDALKLGISMIHQELMPFPDLTVAENIFMGQEPATPVVGWIDRRRLHENARQLLQRLGVGLSSRRLMRELSVAEMQTVEIAKAIAHQCELLIMDEPTSSLSEREVDALFAIIRDLQQRGVAIIYISHRLREVFQIADHITVLRDGRQVASHPASEVNEARLIALMVGRELRELPSRVPATQGEVVLAARGLTKAGQFRDIDLEVRRGEVLGLAGLLGAGRTELVNALYGLAPAASGEIRIHGRRVHVSNPRVALDHGLALVTEDRRELGLILKMSVKANLTLSSLPRCSLGPLIRHPEEARLADAQLRAFGIKTPHRDAEVSQLSGGNQQKVVIAKALLTEPDILMLDEPTRGIDIGAKAEVHGIIRRLAEQGKAILLVSSELPEILALSDRILVMREGSIAAELDPRRTTQEEILQFAMPQ